MKCHQQELSIHQQKRFRQKLLPKWGIAMYHALTYRSSNFMRMLIKYSSLSVVNWLGHHQVRKKMTHLHQENRTLRGTKTKQKSVNIKIDTGIVTHVIQPIKKVCKTNRLQLGIYLMLQPYNLRLLTKKRWCPRQQQKRELTKDIQTACKLILCQLKNNISPQETFSKRNKNRN